MAHLFNLIYGLALALLSPWLIVRALTTNRYRRGLRTKFLGLQRGAVPNGSPAVWFHGVSVGEIHLLGTVIKAFRQRHPEIPCVVSTTTETGMAEATKIFAGMPVFFWPFDFSWAVERTLRTVSPRLVVLAESELWPNFLRSAAQRRIPVIIINGRMSPRSGRRYRRVAWLARRLLFSKILRFAMQSQGYAEALRNLGIVPERVTVTGSVKYDGVLGDRENPKTARLAEVLGLSRDDQVWVAGSTHAPEEAIVLDAFRELRATHQNLRLVLVPRNPDRFDEVARLIEGSGFTFVRKSRLSGPPTGRPAVYLIDTIGDLNAAWGLAEVGFTGGSLDGKRGGQSMIEPAGLGVPVVFGPHTWNFRDAVAGLLEVEGAIRVATAAELEPAVRRLLDDPALRERMGSAARALVLAQQGATERTLDVIDEVLAFSQDAQCRAA